MESFRGLSILKGGSKLASKFEPFLWGAVGQVDHFGCRHQLSELGHPVLGVEFGRQLEERQPASVVLDPELLGAVGRKEWMQWWLPNRSVLAIAHHDSAVKNHLAVVHGDFLRFEDIATFLKYPLKNR